MKKFCESLREHAVKIISFKIKKGSYSQKSNIKQMKMQKSIIF